MAGLKKLVLRTGMEALYFSGAHHLLRPILGGVGAILTLHHVRPPRADAFQPNRLLEVSPRFLEDVIRELRRSDVDIVTLDEMHRRLREQDFRRRFVCLTFDDGYRDNARHALPILRKYDAPLISTMQPVKKSVPSDARNKIVPATSSGLATRLSGL